MKIKHTTLTKQQLKVIKRRRKKSKKLFLEKLRKTTSVNLVSKYVEMMAKSSFLCDDCGITFTRRCSDVVSKRTLANGGNGCPNCKILKGANQSKLSRTVSVHEKLKRNKILVSERIYNSKAWYDFTFLNCGCKHKLKYNVLQYYYKYECPTCNFTNKHILPHTVYYIEIYGRYKIGVTMGNTIVGGISCQARTDFPRYSNKNDVENIRVIKTWDNLTRAEAFTMEAKILNEYAWARYNGESLFADGTGTRELFTHDILGLDDEY